MQATSAHREGQSVWPGDITCSMLEDGSIHRYMDSCPPAGERKGLALHAPRA